MQIPAIILGEFHTLDALPRSEMVQPDKWTQLDSDILAHFVQVHGQIQESRWNKAKLTLSPSAGESQFPKFEDFVFAAVYFRQLTMEKDNLLSDAVDRYCKFSSCSIRKAWLRYEQEQFLSTLDGEAFELPGCSGRALFDSFLYGASLMHKAPKTNDKKRKLFLDLYDNKPREQVIFALNATMHLAMGHVSNSALLIYSELSKWSKQYNLPATDVRWHYCLFGNEESKDE